MANGTGDELDSIFATLAGGVSGIGGGVMGAAEQGAASGGSAGTVLGDVLKSAFGLAPIVTGIMSLFGGGSSTPPPLVDYSMPSPVEYSAAEVNGQIAGLDRDQSGQARSYGSGPAMESAGINVTVQALDAQSFLDRSSDIAAAVRNAMLNSSSINDVVNDL